MTEHGDMRADKGAYETEEVESKIGASLEKLLESQGDSPTPDSEDDHDLETESESTPEDKSADDDSLSQDDDSGDDDADDSEQEADDTPVIPDNVYRSLIHNEWTPEEITEFYEADPEKAMKHFERIHKSTNDVSRQFAQIGRARKDLDRQTQQQTVQEPQTQPTKDFVDMAALREADPDNPLLPAVEGLNNALKELVGQRVQQPTIQEPESNVQEDYALATQVLTFLDSDGMKSYGDFYGPAFDKNRMPVFSEDDLTPGQFANRTALVNKADEIWVGAAAHSRPISVLEALERAHTIFTEPLRTQKVREDLVSQVKKRSKGMTLRPSKGKAPLPKSKKPKTEKELEDVTEARLRDARKKIGG